jgi:putative oxidoreductase
MKAPFLIGRIMFGGFFLYSGINHFLKADEMAPYAESKGVPSPGLAVKLAGVPLIVGGASLILGVKPRIGAMAILGFLAGVSPIMHDFWAREDPGQRQTEMINFVKNMALAGGALALLGVDEPWEASVPAGQHTLSNRVRKIRRTMAA